MYHFLVASDVRWANDWPANEPLKSPCAFKSKTDVNRAHFKTLKFWLLTCCKVHCCR